MNSLKDIILKIKDLSLSFPDINSFYEGDVYQLNENPKVQYSTIVVTQGQHNVDIENQTITYNLIVFFVDRQTSDGDNILDVQSHGVDVLNSIALNLIDDCIVNNFTIDTFKERFSSLCAGAFMRIGITLPINDCSNYKINS